jgi:hypothetical protein
MGTPEDKMKHQQRRQRNFIAKKLREDKRFRPKVIERKRPKHDDGDYDLLDAWLKGDEDVEGQI